MINKIKYFWHVIQWMCVASYYDFLQRKGLSRDKQTQKLVDILIFAKRNVPYFKKLLFNVNISTENVYSVLREMPILTKDIIKTEKNNMYSSPDGWVAWHNTGGSTGEPLKFPIAEFNRLRGSIEAIHQCLLYKKMGYKLGDKICSVDGRRVEQEQLDSNIYWGYNETTLPYGIEHFSTIYLNDETACYYLDKLNEIRPSILRGYPSGIVTLCEYIEKLDYKLSFKFKGVYLTSENVEESQSKYVENILKCPVWGQYGHSEASVFAYSEPHKDEYYCFPLYGYTEILNEKNEQVMIGEEGEIVVTGFLNHALPFIRYQTGDRAIYGGTLPDGTVVLKKLLGRTSDYLIDKNNKRWYLVGLIFGGHLKAFNVIKQWQLKQTRKGEVEVYIVPNKQFESSMEEEIISFFHDYCFSAEIIYVANIEKTSRGKQKFLIQELN